MRDKALGQGHSQNIQPSTFDLRGLLISGMPLPWGFTMHFRIRKVTSPAPPNNRGGQELKKLTTIRYKAGS
jgi:hypothetical protein